MKKLTETQLKELIDIIWDEVLLTAPESQLSSNIKENLKNFKGSYKDRYKKIIEISKLPLTQISPFVKTLTELDKYYEIFRRKWWELELSNSRI